MKVLCKHDLYKSTYRKNAFNAGKVYFISSQDKQFYRVVDEMANEMDFSKSDTVTIYYIFNHYFTIL